MIIAATQGETTLPGPHRCTTEPLAAAASSVDRPSVDDLGPRGTARLDLSSGRSHDRGPSMTYHLQKRQDGATAHSKQLAIPFHEYVRLPRDVQGDTNWQSG